MIETVAFGGGCFWCTEAVFLSIKGVSKVTSGYAGGTTQNPTYDSVSGGKTGHAEVIEIEYDSSIVPFSKLLEVFFDAHDPTTLNRQGNDYGTQYRSIILYTNENQKNESEAMIQKLDADKKYTSAIVTEVVPLDTFYKAEGYHQDYYAGHEEDMYSQLVIKPKLNKVKKIHSDLLK